MMDLMSTNNAVSADNQQEMSQRYFYYTGFCCGEMSCSLLRLSNKKSKTGGVYDTPDITVSHSNKEFLNEINKLIADKEGIISKIKGGFNLSIRGKRKVKKILAFFKNYPPIVGDLSLSKLFLINKAIGILEARKNYRRSYFEQSRLEEVRTQFKSIKKTAIPVSKFPQKVFAKKAIGYFLSGVLDAEGSVGIKRNGNRGQPFFAVAMKDSKIIRLFKKFLKMGHIHDRPKEKILHFEIGSRKEVLAATEIFLEKYPSKLIKMRRRMCRLRQILNDYTLGPALLAGLE